MRAVLMLGVRRWPVAVLLGLVVGLAAGPAAAAVIKSQPFKLPAAKPAPAPAFAKRSTPLPDARRFYNLKESRLRDHYRRGPIKPLPPGFKGLATPPPAKSVTRVARSVLDFSNAIDLLTNRALKDEETNSQTSTVCEPSLAVRGDEVLLTGNWFAAFSKDGGQTFKFIEPHNAFPETVEMPFCCDQVAHYDRRTDTMFWLLQYMPTSDGNLLRLAVAHGDDVAKENWRYYDLSPKGVGGWEGEWFDYPDLAVGSKFLYLTVNLFATGDEGTFRRVLCLRLPLDDLAKGGDTTGDYFASEDDFSLRAAQGASSTMHFACLNDPATIRVFSWPEAGTEVNADKVAVEVWRLPEARGAYETPGPDGHNWLNRTSPRITAGWAAKGNIGFAWTAPQDDNYPFPHLRCAILEETSRKVVAQPPLWSKDYAFAYPAAAVNSEGAVGISVAYGGNKLHPGHAVGVLRPAAGSKEWKWEMLSTATGTDGPGGNKWGDYLAVRPHGKEPNTWVATGYSLQGGADRTNVHVQYLRFRAKGE